jgi:hypothetical protein
MTLDREQANFDKLNGDKMPEILEKYAILSYLISYDLRKSIQVGGNPFIGSIFEPHLKEKGFFDHFDQFAGYFESLHLKYARSFHELHRSEIKRLAFYPSEGRNQTRIPRKPFFKKETLNF